MGWAANAGSVTPAAVVVGCQHLVRKLLSVLHRLQVERSHPAADGGDFSLDPLFLAVCTALHFAQETQIDVEGARWGGVLLHEERGILGGTRLCLIEQLASI